MSRDFWSRRKAAVQAEQEAEQRAADAAVEAQREAELAERPDEEILEELGLPDPDTLGPGDDFKVFLTQAVPARIRSRALRRLWISNPVLANIDGLVDYGEDFTDASRVMEGLQTAYQVGKGMTRHIEEMARQAEADLAADEAGAEDPEDTPEEQLADTAAAAPEATPEPPADAEAEMAEAPEDDIQPVRRRMRFSFEDVREQA